MVARPCIDLVAGPEPPDLGANPDDYPGNIVPQNERRTIGQYELEFSVPDLGVQKVHRSCMNSNQDIVVAQLRLWHVGQAQNSFPSVFVDNECPHHSVFSNGSRRQASRKVRAFGTKSAWFWKIPPCPASS